MNSVTVSEDSEEFLSKAQACLLWNNASKLFAGEQTCCRQSSHRPEKAEKLWKALIKRKMS